MSKIVCKLVENWSKICLEIGEKLIKNGSKNGSKIGCELVVVSSEWFSGNQFNSTVKSTVL